MTKILDLLSAEHDRRPGVSVPAMNPLTDDDALQEAQVVDVRLDALTGVAGLIFELRQSLQFQEVNTGVLVARGIHKLAWNGPSRASELTAWSVGSSTPRVLGHVFELSLALWPHPGARLELAAERVAFFVGDVPGLGDAPPDYVDNSRSSIAFEIATWESVFGLTSAVFLEAASTA